MLKFIFFNIFYILFYYKGILTNNFKIRNNDNFLQIFEKNNNYNVEILEPECISENKLEINQVNEIVPFNRKEFLMHDYNIIRNSKFFNGGTLELYNSKEKKGKSYVVLTFYIGDLKFPQSDNLFPYEVNLVLNVVPSNKNNTCRNNIYIVSLLKTIEVNNPSEFEILEGPIKITTSRTSGIFRINVTNFFEGEKWKVFSKNKISFFIKPEDYCYTEIESKLNKPALIIEKKNVFYTDWGEWSQCSMPCDHIDNIQIRERNCIKETSDCFKGDLKESRHCLANLPSCNESLSVDSFSSLKIILIVLPLVLVISIIIILYHIFYRKKGAEKELFENVAGRFMYD
ncbi:thrombospondin-related apical membrane protein, putative [Plasmodium relictum]|uniref:Thrombospondin-related apical membrane protein, putative n=1 Tax=Plasmodium relictum TaxID=85471 RepID=A0A1J1HCC1_PLARL|nr:thrombospondin-related apical membrane protein, putative [Plasmodium relictum]CRH02608.1 thrombospondin-related apical membrane protein, putative [Plasmodium relictum]